MGVTEEGTLCLLCFFVNLWHGQEGWVDLSLAYWLDYGMEGGYVMIAVFYVTHSALLGA